MGCQGEKTVKHYYQRTKGKLKGIVDRYRKRRKKEIKLHGWQEENMDFIEKNKYVLIADEMGLGKTFSALATVKKNHLYPCLIICPKALKINWYREIKRIDYYKSVDLLKGNMSHIPVKNERFEKDYSIIQYDAKKLISSMPKVRSIILDEVHYLKNYRAQRTVAIKEWIKEKSDSTHVIGLSGTPILNKGSEIFSVVNAIHNNLLTWDEFFGNGNDKFVYELHDKPYSDQVTGYMVKPEKMKELSNLLKSRGIMIRHTKSILFDLGLLPPKITEPVVIPKPKGYDVHLMELHSRYGDLKIAQLTKIRQWLAMAKTEFVEKYVNELIKEHEEKVIIFGNYKEPLRKLADSFNTDSHDGDMKTEQRQKLIDDFMNQNEKKVLVMTVKTGGVGLNLTQANHVVFGDYSYSPADMDQAESRAHRLGQKNRVVIHYITAENTVDEDSIEILTKKSNVVNGIIDGTPYPYDEIGVQKTVLEKLNKMIKSQKVKKTKTARFKQKRKAKSL